MCVNYAIYDISTERRIVDYLRKSSSDTGRTTPLLTEPIQLIGKRDSTDKALNSTSGKQPHGCSYYRAIERPSQVFNGLMFLFGPFKFIDINSKKRPAETLCRIFI